MHNRNHLHWQCRRGMLELDILLQGFLDSRYEDLSIDDKNAFETLLEYPDNLLLEYLMGRMLPSDQAIAKVITEIRDVATT